MSAFRASLQPGAPRKCLSELFSSCTSIPAIRVPNNKPSVKVTSIFSSYCLDPTSRSTGPLLHFYTQSAMDRNVFLLFHPTSGDIKLVRPCMSLTQTHLTPLADRPLRTRLVVACFSDHSLVLAAVSVHQPPAQIIHTVRIPATTPTSTCLRTLLKNTLDNRSYSYSMFICPINMSSYTL